MVIEFVSAEDMKSGRGGKHGGTGVRYAGYAKVLAPLVPHLKEQIGNAKDGMIRIKNKDLAEEMGGEFKKRNPTSLYWGTKYVLFDQGITVETGTHKDGDKLLVMRTRDKDDFLPPSLAKNQKKDEGEEVKKVEASDDSDLEDPIDEDLE